MFPNPPSATEEKIDGIYLPLLPTPRDASVLIEDIVSIILDRRAFSLDLVRDVITILDNKPMMEMTTKSSIRVKPRFIILF
jgi:hypothetical protein